MKTKNLILLDELCSHYSVDIAFLSSLGEIGLIEINIIENTRYIHQDTIVDLEKMIRIHHELDVNPEGIDVVFNLLQKIEDLNTELSNLTNRLRLYEDVSNG